MNIKQFYFSGWRGVLAWESHAIRDLNEQGSVESYSEVGESCGCLRKELMPVQVRVGGSR